jgi:hypothetical protein
VRQVRRIVQTEVDPSGALRGPDCLSPPGHYVAGPFPRKTSSLKVAGCAAETVAHQLGQRHLMAFAGLAESGGSTT